MKRKESDDVLQEIDAAAQREGSKRKWPTIAFVLVEALVAAWWSVPFFYSASTTPALFALVVAGVSLNVVLLVVNLVENARAYELIPAWFPQWFLLIGSAVGIVALATIDRLVSASLSTQFAFAPLVWTAVGTFVASVHVNTLDFGNAFEHVFVHAVGVLVFGVAGAGTSLGAGGTAASFVFLTICLLADVVVARVPTQKDPYKLRYALCESSPYARASRSRRAPVVAGAIAMVSAFALQQLARYAPNSVAIAIAFVSAAVVLAVMLLRATQHVLIASRTTGLGSKVDAATPKRIAFWRSAPFGVLYFQIVVASWGSALWGNLGESQYVAAEIVCVSFAILFCVSVTADLRWRARRVTVFVCLSPPAALALCCAFLVAKSAAASAGCALTAVVVVVDHAIWCCYAPKGAKWAIASSWPLLLLAIESVALLTMLLATARRGVPNEIFVAVAYVVGVWCASYAAFAFWDVTKSVASVCCRRCRGAGMSRRA